VSGFQSGPDPKVAKWLERSHNLHKWLVGLTVAILALTLVLVALTVVLVVR
jgi:hypothetical protein